MLPVYKKFIPLAIAILLITLVWFNIRKKTFGQLRFSVIQIALMALYALFIAGLLFTTNMKSGLFDLEVKMGFLFIPIAFMLAVPFIRPGFSDTILKVFVAGCLTGCLFCLSRSAFHYFSESRNIGEFFYTKLSPHFHPSYYALYLNLALLIVIQMSVKKWKQLFLMNKMIRIVVVSFFILMVLLLNSKAGILITILSVVLFLFVVLFSARKKTTGIVAVISILALSFTIWNTVPGLKNRFMVSVKSFQTYSEKTVNPEEGTLQRLVIWKHSAKLIQENLLFGVGTGDVRQELDRKYIDGKFTHGAEKHLNAHNQFLQTTIAIGIIGLLCLLFIFIALMATGIRKKDSVIFFFALILFLNFLFESMLETQAGTVFTAFFISFSGMKEISASKTNSESGN
ncbi:O-Antigen ligase [anaerobic digester metagenome]